MPRQPARTRAYKDSTAQQLRSFWETARLGSLSAAAAHLGLANPTVWQQVHALERELGEPLLEPHARGSRLTEAGRVLAELTGPLVESLTSLKRRFEEARLRRRARLIVGAAPRIFVEDFPECALDFSRRHANVDLTLRELSREHLYAQVEAGEIDFGVIQGRVANLRAPWTVSPWLEFEPLYELDLVLLAPRDHPLARRKHVHIKDLAEFPIVNTLDALIEPGVAAVLEQFKVAAPPPLVEASFAASIRHFVKMGCGIGLVARPPGRPPETELQERVMSQEFGRPQVYLVRRKGAPRTPQEAAFLAIVKERYGSVEPPPARQG